MLTFQFDSLAQYQATPQEGFILKPSGTPVYTVMAETEPCAIIRISWYCFKAATLEKSLFSVPVLGIHLGLESSLPSSNTRLSTSSL